MKKTIMALFAVAISFAACKKEQGFLTPINQTLGVSFKKDSSVTDQTIQAPKNSQLIFSSLFNTGSLNGFSLTNIKVKFVKGGDAVIPKDYIRRIYAVVDGPLSGLYTTETKDSVNNEFSFNSFLRNFAQYQVGQVRIYTDILSSATNNSGAEDNLIVEVTLTYTGYDGTSVQYFQTGSVLGHKTIFSTQPQPFAINSVADASTPASGVILNGQSKSCLSYFVKLSGHSGVITEHKFMIQGQASGAITALKLYDIGGTNSITQANVVGGVATIITSDAISAGFQKNYRVEPVVNVNSGSVSNYDFNITLDEVKAVSSITAEQKSDPADRIGNPFTVFKAMLEVKKVAVPTLVIANNSMMDIYTVDLTAINGDVSLKELAYLISLDDQSNNDTLFLKSFQILDENGMDITAQFRFTDAASAIDTLFSESDTKLRSTRIAGTGETIIPVGVTKRLRFRAFVGGFNHPLDGDGFSVVPASDNNTSTGLKYLNTGGLALGNVKLHSSPAANASAQNFNWVWSDRSSPNHSGQPSQNSQSNDWIGGQKVSFATALTVNNFHQ